MGQWYPFVAQRLATAWRWRWTLVATAWFVCILGWIAVALIPNSYESKARLYVDTDAVLTPLLRGIAVDVATENQLEVMRKTLLSQPNLQKMIGMTNLELQVSGPRDREMLLMQLAKAIKVESEDRNIFTISYRNSNPRMAHDVVAALLSIFMEEASRTNRSDMNNAQRFLDKQLASYQTQLQKAEQRRADFRQKYLDILPLESNGGYSELDADRVEIQNLEAQSRDATARLTALQMQLASTPANLSSGMSISTQQTELAAAESRLADLRSRFTDQNPDVIITRRLVDSLRASAGNNPATAPAGRAMPNPLYAQVRLQVIDAQSTVSSLKARLDTARKDRDRLEALARAAPGVEAQYQNLDRDYNVIRKNYEELLARREASNITEAADTTADKVQLRIIDPPVLPIIPVAPNRLLLISVVLIGGIAAAGGLGFLLGQLDQSVIDVGRLRTFGHPVLGGISMVPGNRRNPALAQVARVSAAVVVLIALYGGLAKGFLTHPGLMP